MHRQGPQSADSRELLPAPVLRIYLRRWWLPALALLPFLALLVTARPGRAQTVDFNHPVEHHHGTGTMHYFNPKYRTALCELNFLDQTDITIAFDLNLLLNLGDGTLSGSNTTMASSGYNTGNQCGVCHNEAYDIVCCRYDLTYTAQWTLTGTFGGTLHADGGDLPGSHNGRLLEMPGRISLNEHIDFTTCRDISTLPTKSITCPPAVDKAFDRDLTVRGWYVNGGPPHFDTDLGRDFSTDSGFSEGQIDIPGSRTIVPEASNWTAQAKGAAYVPGDFAWERYRSGLGSPTPASGRLSAPRSGFSLALPPEPVLPRRRSRRLTG